MSHKTIAIIGAGQVGGALGKGWSNVGHTIIYGVTNPNDPKFNEVSAQAGHAKVTTVSEASGLGDIIVLAVPWNAISDAIKACGDLSGRTIIDATNPLTTSQDSLELAIGFTTSGGEEVAKLAVGAHVFKAMNQVGFSVMSDTQGYTSRPVIFVAGDDEVKKLMVLELVSDLGFDSRDAGPLRSARLLEPYAMLWIDQVLKYNAAPTNAFSFMSKDRADSVVEYIRYELSAHQPEDLINAYQMAVEHLKNANECIGYQLSQCTESPENFILRIDWKSSQAHLTDFRGGVNFPPFYKIVKPFIPEIAEMRHYAPTHLNWVRS